ncbi:MAG: trigger factor [Flavobacteriaceae bacterium]
MNISRTDVDALNAEVTIQINRSDFEPQVNSILQDYKKNSNLPGFRKGHVPMGMIKKRYEIAVIAEEVNKLLREKLDSYLKEEKIDLLGYPLPKESESPIDWNSNSLDFAFELGLAPKFEVKLDILKKVTHYVIEPDTKMINEQVEYIRKQYGKLISQKHPDKGVEITAQFRSEIAELEKISMITFENLKSKKVIDDLKNQTTGAVVSYPVKGMFSDEDQAKRLLGLDNNKWDLLKKENITLEIKEINKRELAVLDKSLFDKLYEPGTVTSEVELKDKIKEGLKKQFEPQTEQKLLNDITEYLVDKTKFDLPKNFLQRWIQSNAKEEMTDEQAKEEYQRSEKGIRYQLIESQIIKENQLDMSFEELKDFTGSLVKNQMLQYGQQPDEQQMEGIISNVLSNQEETRRISEQLMSNKILAFFKENAPLKVKKVGFDTFIKEAYGKA